MTTIAYRAGVLAADSLISYQSYTNGSRPKITTCGDFLVAMAGPARYRRPLEEWIMEGHPPDQVPKVLIDNEDKFNALIVDKDGLAHEFDNGFLLPVFADYTAVGSGSLLALGAMAHGASAEEAVIAACLHDKSSGGPVSAMPISALQ